MVPWHEAHHYVSRRDILHSAQYKGGLDVSIVGTLPTPLGPGTYGTPGRAHAHDPRGTRQGRRSERRWPPRPAAAPPWPGQRWATAVSARTKSPLTVSQE